MSSRPVPRSGRTTLGRFVRVSLSTIAGGMLLTAGCVPPHATPYSRLTPAEYCPGDSVVAAFDVVGSAPCVSHSGMNCADLTPTIEIATTSAALPSARIAAFAGERVFVPTESAVTATFSAEPSRLFYPAIDAMGREIIVDKLMVTTPHTATRIDGEIDETLDHAGMCNGTTPVHASVPLPGAPRHSGRLVAQRICNLNAEPILVSVGDAAGGGVSGMLSPGGCLPLGFPSAGRVAEVSRLAVDPNHCGTLQTQGPPPPLRTRVFLACGG
jgi:hypothetical protein